MRRRARAIGFAVAALACAALAASLAGGYRADVAAQYGDLRPVVVTRDPLPAGRVLGERLVKRSLEVRRVPQRFAPPDALADPAEALGSRSRARIPAGSYVVASHLADRGSARTGRRPRAGPGRMPVEIAVAAAGATAGLLGRSAPRVDVIVTTEPGPGMGRGRTYVAARGVRLLDLRSTEADIGAEAGPGGGWIATLALTRPEALRLIQAESFARQVRVIGRSREDGG